MNKGFTRFGHFVESHFKFSHWSARQRDRARVRPQVSAAYLFEALVYQVVLVKRSLLALDLWLRAPHAAHLLPRKSKRRGSDTTLLNALGQWGVKQTRQASVALHRMIRERGHAHRVLGSGRKVTLAIVDGSCFGGFWACALGIAGALWQMLDIEPYEKRGKELPAARALMKRAVQQLGAGFASHLLYDGLMAVKADFQRALLQWGMHLVVKTTEQTLEPIASSRAAWEGQSDAALRALGVEVVRGTDAERGVDYVVVRQHGIVWDGLAFALNVAWVRETPLKGKRAGQTEEFWVLTTDETLRAEELREVAHIRWTIENHGFKTLNALVGSKRAYLKNAHARHALLLIWSIGLTLLNAYTLELQSQHEPKGWGLKITRQWLAHLIEWSAIADEIEQSGGSP